MAPLMKIRVTPSFSRRDSCKRQTIDRGSTKMKRSDMKFIEPYAKSALVEIMQWPGFFGFQYLSIGVQPNIWV